MPHGIKSTMEITTVIFDIGGVLITNPMSEIKHDISITLDLNLNIVEKTIEVLLPQIEKGIITEENFWNKFKSLTKCTKKLPENSLLLRELAKNFKPFPDVMELVRKLKKFYKMGIISDTNQAHVNFLRNKDFFRYFNATVFSCEVGCRKPEEKIFRLALQRLETTPEETVFIDDRAEFAKAARDLGINGIQFVSAAQLKRDLIELGVKLT